MDELSDLMNSETDSGENAVQGKLFDVEEVGGAVEDEESQDESNPPASTGNASCAVCGQGVNRDDPTTHEEVTAWIRGPKKDSAVLRRYTGRVAHGACIEKLRAGIAADQVDLETLVDAPAAPAAAIEDIFTDRSPIYRSGFQTAYDGNPPPANMRTTGLTPDEQREWIQGYNDAMLEIEGQSYGDSLKPSKE